MKCGENRVWFCFDGAQKFNQHIDIFYCEFV